MRLLIVSNRLPFSVKEENERMKFEETTGGLVTGISAYLDSLKGSSFTKLEHLWIGWPGIAISKKILNEVMEKCLSEFRAYPVLVSKNEMDNFYLGFCNKTLWPLFHCFPAYAVFDEDFWKYYRGVNEIFSNTIIKILEPDDILWIHDYHLMLLPKLIRDKFPEIPIGFFLHIPFPPYEVFRLLPKVWRKEILDGLLGADLIGFHINEYTQNFLRCILRISGYENNIGEINIGDRVVKADTFPMGIQFKKFFDAMDDPKIQKEREALRQAFGDIKAILSVDRLDYTKGILNRLSGYELFLEKNPDWHKKLIFILITVPSRIGIESYQRMKNKIDELVGKINSRFGSVDWIPINYQYKYLPFEQLVSLYSVSDVCLITPLMDGMNLIAKEYIASRKDETGVLILSEMAGASKELGEAIIINPNHKEDIAEAIKKALEMPVEEQKKRNEIMQKRLSGYDVVKWADEFIQALLETNEQAKKLNAKLLSPSERKKMIEDFKNTNSRIIFLDYDGTLVPFAEEPRKAKPDEEVIKLLKLISEYPQTELVLTSGRDQVTVTDWFGMLNIAMVAEHGVWIKEKNREWKLIKPLTNDWKPKLLPLLKMYADRLPFSFIEEKEFSLVWHYRKADPEMASIRAKELMDDLISLTANIDIQISQGSKVIEIRNSGINKGVAGTYFISKGKYDFVLAIGDDWTDEDLFKILPIKSYSIKAGISPSYAKFNLRDYREVRQLINEFLK